MKSVAEYSFLTTRKYALMPLATGRSINGRVAERYVCERAGNRALLLDQEYGCQVGGRRARFVGGVYHVHLLSTDSQCFQPVYRNHRALALVGNRC
jgi:hypothetical protein